MSSVILMSVLVLAILGSPLANLSASQTLTKCTAISRPLNLVKARPQKISGMALARSTVEYHLKMKTATNVNVKLTNSELKLDVYSLRPSTIIMTNVDVWSSNLSPGTEYVLVVKNCSGKAPSRFQLEITSN